MCVFKTIKSLFIILYIILLIILFNIFSRYIMNCNDQINVQIYRNIIDQPHKLWKKEKEISILGHLDNYNIKLQSLVFEIDNLREDEGVHEYIICVFEENKSLLFWYNGFIICKSAWWGRLTCISIARHNYWKTTRLYKYNGICENYVQQ